MPDQLDLAQRVSDQHLADALGEHNRNKGPARVSRTECLDCEEPIPVKRLQAVPGCQRCVICQQAFERGGSR